MGGTNQCDMAEINPIQQDNIPYHFVTYFAVWDLFLGFMFQMKSSQMNNSGIPEGENLVRLQWQKAFVEDPFARYSTQPNFNSDFLPVI